MWEFPLRIWIITNLFWSKYGWWIVSKKNFKGSICLNNWVITLVKLRPRKLLSSTRNKRGSDCRLSILMYCLETSLIFILLWWILDFGDVTLLQEPMNLIHHHTSQWGWDTFLHSYFYIHVKLTTSAISAPPPPLQNNLWLFKVAFNRGLEDIVAPN